MRTCYILAICAILVSASNALALNCISLQDRALIVECVTLLLPDDYSVKEVNCVPAEFRTGEGIELLVGAWRDKSPTGHKQYSVTSDGSSWVAHEMNWWLSFTPEHQLFSVILVDPVDILTANQMLDAVGQELEDGERPTSIKNTFYPGVGSRKGDDGQNRISGPGPEKLAVWTQNGDRMSGRVFWVWKIDSGFVAGLSSSWMH